MGPKINREGAEHIVARLAGMVPRVCAAVERGYVEEAEGIVAEMRGLLYVLKWNREHSALANKGRYYVEQASNAVHS